MKVHNIGLLGGRGYVGQEILKLLDAHPQISLTSIYSSSHAGESVEGYSKGNLVYSSIDLNDLELGEEDAYVLALPNNKAQQYVEKILTHNPEAILLDLSSDYRFSDLWQYRVPELSGAISSTKISNPGCYATAMQLMLKPLLSKLHGHVNFFGISGFSGAGASPNARNNQDSLAGNVLAYSLVDHLHEQEVKRHTYDQILFTPHVGEFFRGIHITGNMILSDPMSSDEAKSIFDTFYADKPLIKIQSEAANLQQARETSYAFIGGFEADENIKRLTFCCTIDNLLKGAATQAVQNLNSAFGWEDNVGIIK